jgi:hypothetical protein
MAGLALAVAVAAAVPALSEPTGAVVAAPPVSEAALRGHLAFLADDLLQGRESGSRGYDLAALYVAARFESVGLEPAGDGDSYYQPVPLLRNQLEVESARLQITRGRKRSELLWGEDFLMRGDAARGESSVTAPVVFVGYGIAAPGLGYDDYAGTDVEGKIVLTLTGAPPSFPHNQRAYYSSGRTKAEEAVLRGAVGLLRLRTRIDAERVPWERMRFPAGRPGMRWLKKEGEPAGYFPTLRGSAVLSRSGARKLLARTGVELEELLDTADKGSIESIELPVEVTLHRRTTHERVSSPNVAALLRGSDPELRDEYVVYTAHLDHIGIGAEVEGDRIYNGAYDNAMGVSVLLETASAFAELPDPPRRSILFLAVTGEEKGLLGSEYFAHHPSVPIEGIVANVNLDMPLFLSPLVDVVAFGAEHSSLGGTVGRAASAVGFELSPDPMPEEVLFIRSDQYSMVRRGVPAVFLVAGVKSADGGTGGTEVWREFLTTHYHRPSDDLTRPVDYPSAVRFTQVNFLVGLEVANEASRPSWNDGDFFGERFASGD